MEAGPSRPGGPHPSHEHSARQLRPPAPPVPARAAGRTLPIKVLQGASTKRTDDSRPGFARDTIFVTRNTKLGALIGRARTLILDEGYTHLTLYALSAAIPHALLLLHALMDVLPFPAGPGGMWYEIVTDTVECLDEVSAEAEGEQDNEFAGLGAIEEDAQPLRSRNKASMRIDLHVSPRGKSVHQHPPAQEQRQEVRVPRKPRAGGPDGRKKTRPSSQKRKSTARRRVAAENAMAEEDMMNG